MKRGKCTLTQDSHVTPRLAEQSRKKTKVIHFTSQTPSHVLSLWFVRLRDSPGWPGHAPALLGDRQGPPHPSEHGMTPWQGMDAPAIPALLQGSNSLALGRPRLGCAATGVSPGCPTPTTARGWWHQHHGWWHSPSRAKCQRSQQPSQVLTAGFAPCRKHRKLLFLQRSLQSWAGAQL